MMSYRYDSTKKRKSYFYAGSTLFLTLVFFTPFFSFVFDLFEKPLMRSYERSSENIELVKGFFAKRYAVGKVVEENQELQRQIDILKVDVLRTEYLESVLDSYQIFQEDETIIPGLVVLKSPYVQSDTLLINIGSNAGVSTGDLLISSEYLLLGKVIEVFDKSSQVELYTKNNSVIPAVVYPHGESIELVGSGSSFQAELSRDSLVEVGDTVYAQEMPGYLLAVVRKVEFDPRDPYKKVYFSLPIHINSIQTIGIIKNNS